MLTKIETKNYRNLDLEDGVTLGALNIFVGPNGSGKSNLIRVMKFIQDGLIGAPDPRRGVSSFESAVADFGSNRILDATIKPPALLSIRISFDLETDFVTVFDLDLNVQPQKTLVIEKEWFYRYAKLQGPTVPEFYYFRNKDDHDIPSADAKLRVETDVRGSYRVRGFSDSEFTFLLPTERIDFAIAGSKEAFELVDSGRKLLTSELISWGFYESSVMDVEEIRHPRLELGAIDQTLNPAGDNLISVLSNLFRDNIDFEERLLDAFKELFPKTRRLRVVAEGRTLALQWFTNGISEPFYVDQMSTGTIRMLCWATVLLSPKKHKLIVIEEPENDIHPAWLRVLAGWIREAARESQVIVSTHSPDLLDFFTDTLESVRVFEESPNNPGHNAITMLDPVRLKEQLDEGWKLGDLYRVGDPSVGGWPW